MTIEVFLCVYLLFINLLTFIAFGTDKFKATTGQWRILEATLLLLSLSGGWPAGWVSIFFFRHKTRHFRFLFWMILITVSWIIGIIVFLTLQN